MKERFVISNVIKKINRLLSWEFYKTRNGKILANLTSSIVLKYINLVINLLLVPLTLGYLDSIRYGLWMALYSVLSWFMIFDIGIGDGLRNKLVELKAHNDTLLSRKYISTAYFLFGLIAILVSSVYVLLDKTINWARILNAPYSLSNELNYTAEIVVVMVSLNLILRLINNILAADMKTAVTGVISVISHIITLLGIIVLSRVTEQSIAKYAILYMSANTFTLFVASVYLFITIYRDIAPSVKYIDISLWKYLVPTGLKFFFITISSTLIINSTGLLISNLLGPEHVTVYSIYLRYFSMVTMIFAMMVQPLWSGYGDAYHRHDFSWIRKTIQLLNHVLLMVSAILIVMIIAQKFIFHIWIGDKIQVDLVLSILFGVYFVFFMMNSIYQPFINATSKIRLQMIAYFIMSIVYVLSVVVLVKCFGFGVRGVVFALIIVYALPLSLLSKFQAKMILLGAGGLWEK